MSGINARKREANLEYLVLELSKGLIKASKALSCDPNFNGSSLNDELDKLIIKSELYKPKQ